MKHPTTPIVRLAPNASDAPGAAPQADPNAALKAALQPQAVFNTAFGGVDPMGGVPAQPNAAPPQTAGADPLGGAGADTATAGASAFGPDPNAAAAQQPQTPVPEQSVDITEAQRSELDVRYSRAEQDRMLAALGPRALDFMLTEARQYASQRPASQNEPNAQQPETPDGKANAPAKPDPKAGVAGGPMPDIFGGLTLKDEAVQEIRSVIGDDAYDGIISPMADTLNKTAKTLGALVNHNDAALRTLDNQLIALVFDRANSKVFGDSFDGLTKEQQAARAKGLELVNAELAANPNATLRAAIALAERKLTAGASGARGGTQPTPDQIRAARERTDAIPSGPRGVLPQSVHGAPAINAPATVSPHVAPALAILTQGLAQQQAGMAAGQGFGRPG
jgi:hypothetical protein